MKIVELVVNVIDDARNLSQHGEYHDTNSLVVGNGEKLSIAHVGNSYLHTLKNNNSLLLKDMLHVPNMKKNLLNI